MASRSGTSSLRLVRLFVLLVAGLLASLLMAHAGDMSALLASATVSPVAGKGKPLNLFFIHHSCGGALLATPGQLAGGARDSGERCIYDSHPNGGGLRDLLTAAGYRVHQASYGSIVGQDTDICHWRVKFLTHMDRILRTQRQDTLLPDGQTNQIVCFKSCYPNNMLTGRGTEPGNPDDCERTVSNAKAAYHVLLPLLRTQPAVLFIAFTAPPMAEFKPVGWKQKLEHLLKPQNRGGKLAREFNTWLADREHGWLAGYELPNVVVFDFYHILTGEGAGDYAAYPTHDGRDSHPSREGNAKAATAFMTVLEAGVAGIGWTAP